MASTTKAGTKTAAPAKAAGGGKKKLDAEGAKERLAATGRNEPCPCGSGAKYKKCHLPDDQAAAAPKPAAPDVKEMVLEAWRLFEQRRPAAAEKQFRAALAVDATSEEAQVGIGMSRLQSGDHDGARAELGKAVEAGAARAKGLAKEGIKDAFTSKPEAQPYIRASHALGCLAYDQNRFADALADLEKVYAIDDGTVGTEARLIAAKALMKLERAADVPAVLEPALSSEAGAPRAHLGLALALATAGKGAEAKKHLGEALEANPHFGKVLAGKVHKRAQTLQAAPAGTLEEALVYQQTYGDVWTDDARKLVEEVLAERKPKHEAPAATADESDAGA